MKTFPQQYIWCVRVCVYACKWMYDCECIWMYAHTLVIGRVVRVRKEKRNGMEKEKYWKRLNENARESQPANLKILLCIV